MSSGAVKRASAAADPSRTDPKRDTPTRTDADPGKAKEAGPFASIVHLVYALLAAAMALSPTPYPLLSARGTIRLVAAALVYDNTILGVGRWIWRYPKLHKLLSVPRFPLHVLGLPLLLFAAADIAGAKSEARTATTLLFGVMFLLGLHRLTSLRLGIKVCHGVVSVTSALPNPIDGLSPTVAVMACLIAGGHLWRELSFPYLFLGSAAVFLGVGAPVSKESKGLCINLSELVFSYALLISPSLSSLPAHAPA